LFLLEVVHTYVWCYTTFVQFMQWLIPYLYFTCIKMYENSKKKKMKWKNKKKKMKWKNKKMKSKKWEKENEMKKK